MFFSHSVFIKTRRTGIWTKQVWRQ